MIATGRKHRSHVLRFWRRGLTLLEGHARFIAPCAIDVSGETLKANRIFINVGGRAAVPDLPGLRDVPYLTNSSILQLEVAVTSTWSSRKYTFASDQR